MYPPEQPDSDNYKVNFKNNVTFFVFFSENSKKKKKVEELCIFFFSFQDPLINFKFLMVSTAWLIWNKNIFEKSALIWNVCEEIILKKV